MKIDVITIEQRNQYCAKCFKRYSDEYIEIKKQNISRYQQLSGGRSILVLSKMRSTINIGEKAVRVIINDIGRKEEEILCIKHALDILRTSLKLIEDNI